MEKRPNDHVICCDNYSPSTTQSNYTLLIWYRLFLLVASVVCCVPRALIQCTSTFIVVQTFALCAMARVYRWLWAWGCDSIAESKSEIQSMGERMNWSKTPTVRNFNQKHLLSFDAPFSVLFFCRFVLFCSRSIQNRCVSVRPGPAVRHHSLDPEIKQKTQNHAFDGWRWHSNGWAALLQIALNV